MTIVVVDAMGGDHAPAEVIAGARLAADESDREIVLVGPESELRAGGAEHPRIRILHAPEVIGMGEHPAQALKKRPGNSISVGLRHVKEHPGSAFVSAGSTGAVMAGALFVLKRLPGVERPPIASVIPTLKGSVVVADVGANVDCKPSHIGQFALMAAAYARFLNRIEDPGVGLLNIGSEPTKGDERTQEIFAHLSSLPGIRFVGNVEPEAIYAGGVDAVVTDGFAGNIFLKTSEAVAGIVTGMVKEALAAFRGQGSLPGGLAQGLAQGLSRFDPHHSDYAGAPLLGVDGTAFIVHGAARRETIRNAIRVGGKVAASGYLQHIRGLFSERKPETHAI